jgi:hypothetical protein
LGEADRPNRIDSCVSSSYSIWIFISRYGEEAVGWTNFIFWRGKIYSAQTGCITHTQSSRTHRVPGAGSLVVMQPEPEADNSFLSGMAVKRGATLPPPLPLPYLNTLESCPRKFPSDVLRLHDTR